MADNVDETPQEKPKKGMLWILIAALILVVTGDLAFRALSYFRSPKAAAAAGTGEVAAKEADKKGSREAEKPKKVEVKAAVSLDPFLVNLADKEAVCYVKATFQLGLAEENEETVKNPVVLAAARDTIISLLSSKTSEQILTTEGKNKLREEIRNRVNAVLPKGKVHEVYIVDFVVSP